MEETITIETIVSKEDSPETTVTTTVEYPSDENEVPSDAADIVELPGETKRIEENIGEEKVTKIIKKRKFKKQKGPETEITEITSLKENQLEPITTVTIFTYDTSDIVSDDTLEQFTQIKPPKNAKPLLTPLNELEITDLHTLEHTQDIGELDHNIPQAKGKLVQEVRESVVVEAVMTQKPVENVPLIEELPEEIEILETKSDDGTQKKKVIKKRTIRKRLGSTQEDTHIVTIEEEGRLPQSTVTIEEMPISDDAVFEQPKVEEPVYIEELPEEIIETEVDTLEGPKIKIYKKRTIKKRKGDKVESTEIFTVQEEGKEPLTTVTIEELPEKTEREKIVEKKKIKKGKKQISEETPEDQVEIFEEDVPKEEPVYIVELPEEVEVKEEKGRWGTKQKIIKKKVIRKRKGSKQEDTHIVTVEEEGKQPQTTVTIEETEIPEDTPTDMFEMKSDEIEEMPEQVIVTKVHTSQGQKTKIIKKKVFKKRKGSKQEETEIVTVEEEGKSPEISVIVKEVKAPKDDKPKKIKKVKKPKESLITEDGYLFVPSLAEGKETPEQLEEMIQMEIVKKALSKQIPEHVDLIDEEIEQDKGITKKIVKKITKTKKQKVSEIEIDRPLLAEELPEEIQVVEEMKDDGTTDTKIIKTRVIKKQKGDKQEITQIVTIEETDKKPQTTVVIEEIDMPEEFLKELSPETIVIVEEIPERTERKGVDKRIIKKKIIKRRKGSNQENTEITVIEEKGKKPQSTVTIEEIEFPEEDVKKLPELEEERPLVIIQEVPEQVQVFDVDTKTKIIKKNVTKTRKGSKQETKSIFTVEEEDKKPITTTVIEQIALSDEVLEDLNLPTIKPKKPVFVEDILDRVKIEEVSVKRGPKKTIIKKKAVKVDKKEHKEEPEQPFIAEELPEEVCIVHEEGDDNKKIVKKRTIRTRKGSKHEITKIYTVEEEDKQPISTVVIEEIEYPEEIIKELPDIKLEQTVIIEEVPEEDFKQVKTKRKVINKRKGSKQETTEIIVREKEGETPETTVVIEEIDVPDDSVKALPEFVEEQEPLIVEKLPEEIQVIDKKTIKKKVVRKRKGSKQETTEHVVILEDGKKPQDFTVTEEIDIPDNILKELSVPKSKSVKPVFVEDIFNKVKVVEVQVYEGPKKKLVKKKIVKKTEDEILEEPVLAQEQPEEIRIVEDDEGKKVIKKRVIRTRKGKKEELTQIVTTEEDGKQPETTVVIEEIGITEEELPERRPQNDVIIEEQPEIVEITETEKGPKRVVVKKKIVKRRKGSKQESTEILVREEEGKKPITTVTIEEFDVLEDDVKELPFQPEEPIVIQEYPEEVTVKDKTTTKKKVIKKRKGSKQESVLTVTVEELGQAPQTSVIIEETQFPDEILKEFDRDSEEPLFIEEIPEDKYEITETVVERKPGKKVIKKKIITKKPTFEEAKERPESPDEIEEQPVIIQELPEEVQIFEDETGPKKTTKKRVITKRKGSKQETTHIVTVEEVGKKPKTTVTIEEVELPELTEEKTPVYIEELPEEVEVEEVKSRWGPKKKTTKKRIIRKRKGSTQEDTYIVTVEEEGKKPETSITVVESTVEDVPQITEQPEQDIIELPEEIKVIKRITPEGPKKETIKKRVIKKKKGGKQEQLEIVTVEREGEKPESTVTVKETDIPGELLEVISPEITELPEEIKEEDVVDENGHTKKRIIKKRTIKKPKGDKEEFTEIVVIEEEGKEPETTVTIDEISTENKNLPKRQFKKKPKEKPKLRREMSVLMPMEIKEIRFQKVKIVEAKDAPLFGEVKLRKPKRPTEKKDTTTKVQVPRLKSRINYLDFPPMTEKEQLPRISILEPVYRDNGILSRNIKDAEKVPKTKRRRLRDKDLDNKKLEELDLEMEEIKRKELEKIDDEFKFRKPEKKKPVSKDEPTKLKIGKGKVPEQEEVDETVKLKKIPEILKEEKEKPELKPIKKEPAEKIKGKKKPSEETDKINFEPYDIDHEGPELEEYVPAPHEEEDKEKPKVDKTKVLKKKKTKPLPETEETTLELGKPKPIEGEDQPEVTLKYKQTPKPEDEPDEIKLKPHKKKDEEEQFKVKIDTVMKHDTIISFEGEPEEMEITPEDDVEKRKKKKIKKPSSKFETEEKQEEPVLEEEKVPEQIETIEKYLQPEDVLEAPKEEDTEESKKIIKKKKVIKKVKSKDIKDGEIPEIIEDISAIEEVEHIPKDESEIVIEETEIVKKKTIKKIKPIKPEAEKIDMDELMPEEPTEQVESVELSELPVEPEETSEKNKILRKKKVIKKPIDKEEKDEEELVEPILEEKLLTEEAKVVPEDKQTEIVTIPKQEPVSQLAEKPKKPKRPLPKKEEKKDKIPRLKSRIVHVPFPPQNEAEKIPEISQLPAVYRENGILSRNVEEAAKVPKRKKIKIKDYDKELKDLEKLDLEVEDLRKKDLEKVDKDLFIKPEKKKVKKPIEEDKELKIGKGKVPEQLLDQEDVLLKKVPEKVKPEEEMVETKKPKKETKDSKIPRFDDETETDVRPFEPYDIERESPEKEVLDLSKPDIEEKEEKQKQKVPRTKRKKEIPEPETIVDELIPGIPKPKGEEDVPEIKLKKKQKPKPEEKEEEITLKPHKKQKEDEIFRVEGDSVMKHDTIITFEGPDIEMELSPEDDDIKTKGKKKVIRKIKKPKDTKELTEEEIVQEVVDQDKIFKVEGDIIPKYDTTITLEEDEKPEEEQVEVKEKKKIIKKVKKPKEKSPVDETGEEIIPQEVLQTSEEEIKYEDSVVTEEVIKLADIKLKKPKPPTVKEPAQVVIPKLRLKSRINWIDFPPLNEILQPLKMTLIGAEKDNGIISRNVEEAIKLKPKKKKKVVEPLPDLEKLDEELEELKKGREQVDDAFKKRPKKPKKEKPVLMKIVCIEVRPQRAKIVDLTPEVVNFAEIKLRKPTKKAESKEPTELKLPKLKLKSRINRIDFPPLSEVLQTLKITHIGAEKDNGIISRNIEEAEKVKKKKIKKFKDVKKEITDLEKLDLEFEELKKKEPEKVDEAFKYERKPKEKPEVEEVAPIQIKLGKGKLPPPEEVPEDIKLKKIPEKNFNEEVEETVKPKKKPDKKEAKVDKVPKKQIEKPELEPFDIPSDEIEKLEYEKPEYPAEEEKQPDKEKPKYKKKKKEKPTPETEETILKKGEPKTLKQEEIEDTISKAPRKPKPEEAQEGKPLKPHKKEEDDQVFQVQGDTVMKHDSIVTFEGPDIEMEISPEDDKEKPKKKKVIKKIKRKDSKEVFAEEKVPEPEVPELQTPEEKWPIKELLKEEIVIQEIEEKDEKPLDLEVTTDQTDVTIKKIIKKIPKQKPSEDIPADELATLANEENEEEIIEEVAVKKKKVPKKKPLKEKLEDETPEEILEEDIHEEKPVEVDEELVVPKEVEQTEPKQEKQVIKKHKNDEMPKEEPSVKPKAKKRPTPKPEEKKDKIPRLKSRMTLVPFPPQNETQQLPKITDLEPVIKDNGIISRNIDEAMKIKKTKRRKLKDIDHDLTDLEKLDLEYAEHKKDLEKVDDSFKYEKKPKEKEEIPDTMTELKVGKGKLPEKPEEDTGVKLKKVSDKAEQDEKPLEEKKIPEEAKTKKPKKKKDINKIEKPEFEPFDIDQEESEKLVYYPPESPKEEKEEPGQVKVPYKKKERSKPKPEEEEITLQKNKPKPQGEEAPEEIKLKAPKIPKPEVTEEDIKLKPLKKSDEIEEDKIIKIEEPDLPKEDKPLGVDQKKKVVKKPIEKKPDTLIPRLKSRINYIDFPPLSETEQKPKVTELLPVLKDNATLSRNVEEAAKLKPKKKKKPVELELTGLEKLDEELEELKKSREKVDDEFRKRREKPKKEKLIPIKIVCVEIKPQKAKIVDLTPEVVNLAEIKLKKPTRKPELKEPTELKLPKLKLKSRINWVDFPPLSEVLQPLKITHIGAEKDNGVISRNIEEAEKIPKKKIKKFKDVKKELTDLEKLDLEFEELKKKEPERVDEAFKYERKSKEKIEEEKEEPKTLKIGKGKGVPKDEEDGDTVTLKKRPEKKEDVTPEDIVKEKPVQPEQKETKESEPQGHVEGPSLEPFIFEHEDVEKDIYERPEHEEPDKEKPKKKISKKKPDKTTKPAPETVETTIEKGIPKSVEPLEEDEVKFKAPRKPKPDEEAEEFKLKPIKKSEEEIEGKVTAAEQPPMPQEAKLIIPRPDDDLEFKYPPDDDIKKKTKKKTKTPETTEMPVDTEEPTVKVAEIKEKVPELLSEEEEKPQQILIKKKPKVQKDEVAEDVEIVIPKSEKPSEVEGETVTVKQIPKPQEDAAIELVVKPEVKEEEIVEEKVVITKKKTKKPKPEIQPEADVVEQIVIKKKPEVEKIEETSEEVKFVILKHKPSEDVEAEEVEAEIVIKKFPKSDTEEAEATVEILLKPEEKVQEIIEEKTVIKKKTKKLKPKEEEKPIEQVEGVTIEELKPEDVFEGLKVPTEIPIIEEPMEEEQPKPVEITETITEIPEDEETTKIEEVSEDQEISKPEQKESVVEEVITLIKKKKKPIKEAEEAPVEAKIHIPKPKSEQEPVLVEAVATIKEKVEGRPEEPLDTEAEFNVVQDLVEQKKPEVPVEEITEQITIKKKKPKKPKVAEEEAEEVSFKMKKDESIPEETAQVSVDEVITTIKPKQPQKVTDESSAELEITIKKEDITPGLIEEIIVDLKPKEETEQPEAEITVKKPKKKGKDKEKDDDKEIKQKPKDDVEADISLKKPKPAPKTDEGEDEITVKKHVPVNEEEVVIKEKPEDEVEAEISLNKPKPTPKTDEGEDEITVKKHVPIEEEEEVFIKEKPEDEVEAKISLKKTKPAPKTDEGEDEITVKKHVPVEEEEVVIKERPEDEVEAEICLKTPKPTPKTDEGEDEITVKKHVPIEEEVVIKEKPEDKVEAEISLKKPKPTPKTDEGEDEITVKKHVPVEEEEVVIKEKPEDAVEAEISLKKPKPTPKTDEGEDEITVKKHVPVEEEEVVIKEKPEDEVEAEMYLKKPKPTPKTDEGEDEITIKKHIPVKDESKPKDEEAEAVFIKKPTKPEEQPAEVEAEITLKKQKEKSPEEESADIKIKKKLPPKRPSVEEAEELTIQRLKPVRRSSQPEEKKEEEVIPSVTFRPKTSKTKEDVEQEFKISLDSYAEEEISLSSKIKLKKPRRQLTFGEEAAEESVKIMEEYDSEGPAIEEIIDEGSDAEELPLDEEVSENFHVAFKRKPSRKYSIVHEDEEDISLKLEKRQKQEDYGEAEIDIKIRPKRKDSVSFSEDVSLSIIKEKEIEKITVIHEEEVQQGDVYYSVTFYDAEAESACDLVEGERVYVVETQGEWWFVKKHLTEDSGWVPANILMDEPQYIEFVQRKLNEKIDKLPVLEKPKAPKKPLAPKFLEKLKPITTHDGFSVTFTCKVEGYPRPQITWFRQTHIIKESTDFQMFYTEENVVSLVINEVFPEDAGTFTCVAKNSAGFASSTAELTVEGPLSSHGSERTYSISRKSLSRTSSLADILEGMLPVFAKKPKTQSVPEETDVTIDAVLAAIPEPDIKWYRNGKRISTKENITITTTSENYTYTTILRVTKIKKKQEGRYKIVAKNSEGQATAEFTLRVRTADKEPPEIIEPLQSTTIRKSETTTLTTTIVGNPEPALQWFKDGKPLDEPSPRRNGDTYTVIIKNADAVDTGEYTVKARNPLGSAETTAFLTVQEFPDNAEPPLFVKRFEEQNIPEKTPLILRAKVTGNPIPEVTWLLNNRPLEPSDRVRILYDGENIELVIKETNSELDSGNYKCVATNSMGRTSHGASVNVEVDTVKFTKKLQKTYETFERETIELECHTSHSVRTKWWYNDTEISGMDHRVVIQDGKIHKLIIKNISINDGGNYRCTVKNQKTETTVSVSQRKLEFVRKLQDLEITEKDIGILEVEITSDTADVTWFKDGAPIKDVDDKFETEKNKGVRKLVIRSTSIHDEGEYTCRLVEDECKADVTVIELPPEIITPLQDKTVTKGEKAVFEIELSKGDALAKWYKDGKEIQFSEHIQLSIDGKRQKLKVYKCDSDDQGTYTCKVGTQSSSATLTVHVPSLPSCVWIKELPEETIVPINTDAEFEVELSRDDVEETWWRKDVRIEKSSRYTVTKNRTFRKLVVHNVTLEDQYEYTCTVEKYDLKTTSKLTVGEKPSPPRGPLEISGMTAQSFTIQWQPPEYDGNLPILEYIIEIKDTKSKRDFKKIGSTKGTVTDFAVVELKKDHGYKFKIYARNSIGISEPYCPEDSYVAGSRITPPSPPINLNVRDLTSRSATLTWEPPLNDGGSEITGYVVEKKLEYMPKWEKVYTLEAFTLDYTFENLKEKSDYVFRVFAENSVGLSAPAQTDVVQMRSLATVPSPPTAPLEIRTIGPNAIVVEWGIPEWDGGAPLLGYNIALKDTKKTMWMEIGKTPKGLQKFTIRDLQEDHDYLIRIFARNEIGLSGPLESDEPFKVLPSGEAEQDDFREVTSEREPTSRSSETTTSWLRENSMDADIKSYAKGKLLRKDEYFFRIWCYATKLFK